MIPWELLDRAKVPGCDVELVLHRRGKVYSIRIGNTELMNSCSHGSEEALADLACDRLGDCRTARILVGGLGMGFTTAAALRRLGPQGSVDVAELVPEVVAWNRDLMGHLADFPLRDERVRVRVTDVAEILRTEINLYDAVLLDVDNGPFALTSESNPWLYAAAGLKAARGALRPSGILAVWSVESDRGFVERLQRAGFAVEEHDVRARGRKGGHHVIWLARRK